MSTMTTKPDPEPTEPETKPTMPTKPETMPTKPVTMPTKPETEPTKPVTIPTISKFHNSLKMNAIILNKNIKSRFVFLTCIDLKIKILPQVLH